MSENITGRDRLIITQALATAYALIGTLPPQCQEASNRRDMGELLRHWLGEDWKMGAHNLRSVLSADEWLTTKKPFAPEIFRNVEDC